MPIYEYYCKTCNKMIEHYCSNYHGTKRQCCPECKTTVKKELSWEGDAGEYRTNRTTV